MKMLLSIFTLLTIVACDRYQVTLNERQIYTPRILFTNYQIADPALHHCVAQAIINLSNNALTDVKPLMFFGGLKRLDLRENRAVPCKDLLSLEALLVRELLRPQTCL